MNDLFLQRLKPFDDICQLNPDEQRGIMLVNESGAEGEIDHLIRNLFVMAIVKGCPDVHIAAKGDSSRPNIVINVKKKGGFWNWRYDGKMGKYFLTKMFALCGVPQGGSTPSSLGARFQMDLPSHYAKKHGLVDPDNKGFYGIDFRVHYTKTFDGWAMTVRVLDQQKAPGLHDMGLSYSLLREIQRIVSMPSGLVIVSGPTGSGKTTLLNAILRYLNNAQRAIHTLEDPIEFRLWGDGPIKQIQVGHGITFASGLRDALRMAPMVILVGEIRDAETLDVALWAANTGHLVLATKHENNATESMTGMIDMLGDKHRGAHRISEVLRMVIATRLVETWEVNKLLSRPLSYDEKDWIKDNGLMVSPNLVEAVNRPGEEASGRIPINEAIVVDHKVRHALRQPTVNVDEIYRIAADQLQYESLAACGFRAIERRGTTLDQCRSRLETLSAARDYPGFRIKTAHEWGLSLGQVADAIDGYLYSLDKGSSAAPGMAKMAMEYGLDEQAVEASWQGTGPASLEDFLQHQQKLSRGLHAA